MKIEVDGVELTLTQIGRSVTIRRVVARDRKRKLDITSAVTFGLDDHRDEESTALVRTMKAVAAYQTAHCTCDYHYGWSDHAEHCQSLYKASEYSGQADDD